MALQLTLRGICIIIAIILGFLFPAYLIDALKSDAPERPRMSGERPVPALGFW